MKVARILVPIDLSEFSFEAIEPANSVASLYQAEIHLLHVVPTPMTIGYPAVDYQSETLLRDAEEASYERLSIMIDRKIYNKKKLVRVIRRGDPVTEILKFTKDQHMDLIVMATHGRTGLARVMLGSVAEEIIRHSPVPVLVVKPKDVVQELQKDHEVSQASRITDG